MKYRRKFLHLILTVCIVMTCCTSCNYTSKDHVIIISGQSNAVGCSSLFDLKATEDCRYEKALAGYQNIKLSSFCDFHTATSDFEQTLIQLQDYNGFGPEVGIGLKLAKYSKRDNFYIIKVAWGGTSIATNWLENGQRGYYYNISLEFLTAKLSELINQNITIDTLDICWMQGESDGSNKEYAESYEQNELTLFNYFREDLKEYSTKIGIIDAYISTKRGNPYATTVNEAKLKVSQTLNGIYVIETNGEHRKSLNLGFDDGENSHYNSESMYKLGTEFAKVLIKKYKTI